MSRTLINIVNMLEHSPVKDLTGEQFMIIARIVDNETSGFREALLRDVQEACGERWPEIAAKLMPAALR